MRVFLGSDSDFKIEIKREISEENRSSCQCCFRFYRGLAIHHKKYRSRGGKGNKVNGAFLCPRCHDQTHNPNSEEWKIVTAPFRTPTHAEEGQSELDFPEEYPYVKRYEELRNWAVGQRYP